MITKSHSELCLFKICIQVFLARKRQLVDAATRNKEVGRKITSTRVIICVEKRAFPLPQCKVNLSTLKGLYY